MSSISARKTEKRTAKAVLFSVLTELLASLFDSNGNGDGHTDHRVVTRAESKIYHLISCSKLTNRADEKKSKIVISNPSQIF